MKLEKGNRIFYQKNGEFYVDIVADVLSTDEGVLYELVDYDWWCVTENEILDESDERVRDYMCMSKDVTIKLSDVRDWLRYHARDYYEPDSWSLFKDEEMIKDLCKSMLYKTNKKSLVLEELKVSMKAAYTDIEQSKKLAEKTVYTCNNCPHNGNLMCCRCHNCPLF